jgi:hypothetical protein
MRSSWSLRYEIFVQEGFTTKIGIAEPLRVANREVGIATLVRAQVSPDGQSVRLTYEVPDWLADRIIVPMSDNPQN